MPTSPLAATSMAPATASPPAGPAHVPAATRPAAPEIHFVPRAEPAPDLLTCPHCGSHNQNTVRFCVSCGRPLAAAAAAPPAGPAAAAAMAAAVAQNWPKGAADLSRTVPTPPPVHEPTPPHEPSRTREAPARPVVAPGRVVDLAAPAPAPVERLCPRCRAPSEGAAQFCRLCGSPLADGQVLRPTPAPGPLPAAPLASPAPAPAPARVARPATAQARIVLVARDGGEGPTYTLGETTDLGRTEGHIVLSEDPYISPRHARLSVRGEAYFLRDLSSTNGVYFRIPFGDGSISDAREASEPQPRPEPHERGEPEQPLKDQDLFLVGQQVLRFEVVKDAEEGFGVASDNGTLLFGTPASPRYARLSVRTVEGVVRDVFTVRKTDTVLGRESGDIVFTDDPFLSRRHAVLRVHMPAREAPGHERRFTLSDLGSSNGTFLRVQEEVRLRNGDHFRIGQQLFRFDLDAAKSGA